MTSSTRLKLRPEVKQAWLDALRSGAYKQGTGRLYDEDECAYCCLGVLTRLAELSGEVADLGLNKKWYRQYIGEPPESVVKWAFGGIWPATRWFVPYEGPPEHLADLNDNFRLSFGQIAAIIEKEF